MVSYACSSRVSPSSATAHKEDIVRINVQEPPPLTDSQTHASSNGHLFAGNLLATEAGVKQSIFLCCQSIFCGPFRRASTGLNLRFAQAKQLDGIVLENQRPDFVADRDLFEIGEPTIRGNERVIGTKQDFD